MGLRFCLFLLLTTILLGCRSESSQKTSNETRINAVEFKKLLDTMARGWNEGDASKAANCFATDAIYTEPPDKQVYKGRQALYRFFGGDSGREGGMTMTWHHLVFDEESQVGAGEFTFTYGTSAHGVAMIKIRDGLIANWREYWYDSSLPWNEFIGDNKF